MTDDSHLLLCHPHPHPRGAKDLRNIRDIIPNNLRDVASSHMRSEGTAGSSLRLCVSFIYLFIHCYQAELNRFNRPGH